MNENIQGKVIVIIGANSGLGEATARRLSAEGATVVLGAWTGCKTSRKNSKRRERSRWPALGGVRGEGGPVQEIHPGDVVWFPPGLRHWHGASPTTAMSHFAIQEQLNGQLVDWMEKVSDEQYSR